MSIDRTLNLKALSSAVGKDASWLSKKQLPHALIGNVKFYNADEVRAWITANVREIIRKTKAPLLEAVSTSKEVQPPAPTSAKPMLSDDDPILADLKSGDALRVTRAAMKLASLRVSNAAQTGTIGANDLDDLKKALGELRQAEDSYIELGIRKGEIIERSMACEIIGSCCSRLVEALGVVENSIAVEVDMWLADDEFRVAPSELRQRKVREYVARLCHEVRRQQADGVDAMVDAQIAESIAEKTHDA